MYDDRKCKQRYSATVTKDYLGSKTALMIAMAAVKAVGVDLSSEKTRSKYIMSSDMVLQKGCHLFAIDVG